MRLEHADQDTGQYIAPQPAAEVPRQIADGLVRAQARHLAEELGVESARRLAMRRSLAVVLAFMLVVTLTVFVTQGLSTGHWHASTLGNFSSVTGIIAGFFTISRRHKALTSEAATLRSPELVGPLREALEFPGLRATETGA